VGYADSLRPNASFPNPWDPGPNLVFVGNGYIFDAGAIRIDNETDQPRHVDSVVLDLQRPGPVFDFEDWQNFTIPPHSSAVVTQLSSFDLDTSDFPIVGCFEPVPPSDRRIPKVTLSIDGLTASYLDTAHIIDTFGYDLAECSGTSTLLNESLQWRPIGGEATTSPGTVALQPLVSTFPVGANATVEAIGLDAGGEPVPNALVRFTLSSGPNAIQIVESHTDVTGTARFTYPGTQAGIDTIKATMFNTTFTGIDSNPVSVTWLPAVHLALSPASAAQAVGTAYNATLLATDNSGQPVPNLTVLFKVTSGPNAGKSGPGTTGPDGQAIFTFTSKLAGTDTLEADLTLQGGATQASNAVTTTWGAPRSLALSPLTASLPLGSSATVTALLTDGAHQLVANAAVTFRVVNGPDAGKTGQAVTDASGQATFSLTGSSQGADAIQATATGGPVSNLVTVTWTATATTLLYTGAAVGEYSDAMTLSARLTEAATGRPVTGQTITFSLGTQTVTALTGADGTATTTFTPTGDSGALPLTLSFAGGGGYAGTSAALLLPLLPDETVLTYTGKAALASGQTQPVTARLTDGDGTPLPNEPLTFTFGTGTATATTGADGTATATLNVTATQTTGPATVTIAFAGDAYRRPSRASVPVLVYQSNAFVVWGGNTPGLAIGQRVNFWGSQWAQQVTGGDYATNPSFKGYVTPKSTPISLCEPTTHTTGTPLLDANCWTSKPGNSSPPATIGTYIGAIVSTSLAKSGSTIYGNIAATVVLQVDPSSPYGPDPGHPGYGTIVAVIEDGAGLFPKTARKPAVLAALPSAKPSTGHLQSQAQLAVPAGTHELFLYTPEMNLLAETELSTSVHPLIANEYLWWNGHPIAQVDATGVTSWTFTDHLGTPILQTSAQQGIVWRSEYEPFGEVYTLRSYDRHQPLRLPGQEAEELGLGENGVTDRSYNVHRWYRGEWGRYTQADPIGLRGGLDLFTYVEANPTMFMDEQGLTCGSNLDLLLDWWVETGSSQRYYGPQDMETLEIRHSNPASYMRNYFKKSGCANIRLAGYGTTRAFVHTFYHPCGTAFQLGGFLWSATNVSGCRVQYQIYNQASLRSFFYHLPGTPYKPRGEDSFPFGGNLDQYFSWTEVSPCRCACK
jgi:RHS repeat-associated protein